MLALPTLSSQPTQSVIARPRSAPRSSRFACLVLASLLTLLFSPAPGMAQEQNTAPAKATPSLEDFPKVVAIVNGGTISRDKLAKECLRRYGPTVLDNLLNKWLILQACEAKSITITQADVNEEITRTATKFGISTKLFLENLEQERDIPPEQYASEIVWPMLALRALAAEKIAVSPDEIEQVIQSEYGEKMQVRMIASASQATAQKLHAEVTAAPERFSRIATEQSEEAVSASVGGLLPPIRRFSGDDLLEKMAFQLAPEEISPIFQIGELHMFLQGVRKYPASMPNPQMLPLIQQRISDSLRDQRLGEAADEIFSTLQKNSQVIAVLGNPELEQKYPGVAAYINRQPIAMNQLAYECVNRHGRTILRGEIDRLLMKKELEAKQKVIIQPDIDAEIARAADSAGFINSDGSANSTAWLDSIMKEEGVTLDLYIDDAVWPSVALKKLVEDDVQVTDEDLQKGFASNFGPRAEVLVVVLSNQRTAQDVFRQARENLTEQGFGELAAKYSVEPVSRSNFGKIPALRRFGGRPTLEDAAFALQPGQISGVIAWGDQWAIMYKQGETKPIVQDFEAVRPELEREIREKKLRLAMGKKLDAMHQNSEIDNFLEGTSQTGKAVARGAPAVQR
ncbi:peptidylprolyl isomerase [Aureliella helgolandensis]|uniref:peptidylprolyl isomerase n=1 Tax=Aureliella helgolandensis TaxID=2527968 RepID=A0A518GG04_9BACT|nr:peptidylprolyl isomerase [Aureliella helgolandensis]QDV27536.1 peptidylprolyl isomerase [Aureliella helgolandensis]